MNKMKQRVQNAVRTVAVALLSGILSTGCGGGGGGGGGGNNPPAPAGSFALNTNSLAFTAASPTAAAPAPQAVMATVTGNLSGTLFVLIDVVSGGNVVTVSNVVLTGSNTGQATVTPAAPSSLGAGTFNSMLRVRACLNDSSCNTGQLSGSPQMISVSYTVGSGSGTAPTVTITANPTVVAGGGSTNLTWSSTNATSCLASGGWSGAKAISGNQTISNITTASAFTLTCTGAGGTGAATANVALMSGAGVTITATPNTVASGGSTTLNWSSTNANSCQASGSWSGNKTVSGSQIISNIVAESDFTLTCTGPGGSGAATAKVFLAGTFQTEFNGTEDPISEGGTWRRTTSSGFTNVRTTGGLAFGTNGQTNQFDDSYSLLRGFGPNQTAEAVIERSSQLNQAVTHEAQLLLRFTDDNITARGYECLFSFAGNVQIVRWDGLNLGSMMFKVLDMDVDVRGAQLKTGDVIKASIVGDVISLSINGTLVGRARDSTYTTGQPGIGFFIRPGGNSQHLALTRYQVSSN